MLNQQISQIIAAELTVQPQQILAAIQLLDDGNTIPFIARYRKEATGGLDDTQLRHFETRLIYLRELEDRRQTILKSIEEQGKLTDELRDKIHATQSKTELEDLYLPYKPKRRTKGQIAIEAGLEPLADLLWNEPKNDPETAAAEFVNADKGVTDTKVALDGARYILMERFAEDAGLLAKVRDYLAKNAVIVSKVIEGKETEGAKFQDYFDHQELLKNVPSHRALAMFRGRNEGILQLSLNADPDAEEGSRQSYCEEIIRDYLDVRFTGQPADKWREQVIAWTWKIKVSLHLETELMASLREKAEEEAIDVFARNLTALLMAAPLAEGDLDIHIVGDLVSKPYIDITLAMMKDFGVSVENQHYQVFKVKGNQSYVSPGKYMVEGDASSASYFLAAAAIKGNVKVTGIGKHSIQGDRLFADVLEKMGAKITWGEGFIQAEQAELHGMDMDMNHIPDAAMTIATTALFAKGETVIRNIYNWRVKETDRLSAMAAELRKVGAEVEEGEDFIRIQPLALSQFKHAEIETYNDHRMAMCFALIALSDTPVTILDPKCTAKTFPTFFDEFEKLSIQN